MTIVGLTGGIGSGKTTVAKLFQQYFDIPVYFADEAAKELMNNSELIRNALIELFGNEAYIEGYLNRTYLANRIFSNKEYLDKMNAIVHPEVATHFKNWLAQQNSPYILKEAAIIFEHNKQKEYDLIITVIADEKKRIQRVMERDHSDETKVRSIIQNQLGDKEKAEQSNFVIVNNDRSSLQSQIREIHNSILKYATKS